MIFEEFLQSFFAFIDRPIPEIALLVYAVGGYIFFVIVFLKKALEFLSKYKAKKQAKSWNWVYLAIDIPQMNVQTPKAVEQMFANIYSVIDSPDIGTKYRQGFVQNSFSFEIVSIEGYIQFIIRTRDIFRDLIEAALYAQYPEAEITEIEDYTQGMPKNYPNDEVNLWGAEFGLVEHQAFPIRTYDEFVHSISKDEILKDPMSAFLEALSRVGAGEQMWFQMVIEPVSDKDWKAGSIDKIKEVFEGKVKPKKKGGLAGVVGAEPKMLMSGALDQILAREGGGGDSGGDKKEDNKRELTPGQTKLVEAMEEKIRKIGYMTKIRALYIGQKDIFNPAKGVNALIGAMSQFNVPSSNSLAPVYSTGASYFFAEKNKDKKRKSIFEAYQDRNLGDHEDPYVLNIEELATIWHFPMSHVKTPMVQRTESKRAEPPAGLPIGAIFSKDKPPGFDENKEDIPFSFG